MATLGSVNFEGQHNTLILENSVGFDNWFDTGSTSRYSNIYKIDGNTSWWYAGTSAATGVFQSAPHVVHQSRFYYRHMMVPTQNEFICEVTSEVTTTIAAQIGVQTDGRIRLRNGTTEVDESLEPLEINQWYRLDWTLDGNASQTLRIYTGANLHSSNPINSETLAGALTATQLAWQRTGRISSGSTWEFYIDYLELSDSAMPAPLFIDVLQNVSGYWGILAL